MEGFFRTISSPRSAAILIPERLTLNIFATSAPLFRKVFRDVHENMIYF